MNRENLKKIAIGAAVAALGAVLTYALEQVPGMNLGQWTPVVTAVLSVLVNVVRKLAI